MSNVILVEREDHPCNPIKIDESDFNEETDTIVGDDDSVKEPNEGTVAWYEMKLTEMKVDFSDAENKADLVELYEENSED